MSVHPPRSGSRSRGHGTESAYSGGCRCRECKDAHAAYYREYRRLTLAPISIREAGRFVLHHHRHHRPPQGALFALAAEKDGQLVGVCIVGRPVGAGLQDGRTVEITRVATDGTRNACSFLYGRARRAAAALGYERVVTYTRQDESGASPRAAGFEQTALLPPRSWAEANVARLRFDQSTPAARVRWERAA